MLAEIAEESDYGMFYVQFGKCLRLGIHVDSCVRAMFAVRLHDADPVRVLNVPAVGGTQSYPCSISAWKTSLCSACCCSCHAAHSST